VARFGMAVSWVIYIQWILSWIQQQPRKAYRQAVYACRHPLDAYVDAKLSGDRPPPGRRGAPSMTGSSGRFVLIARGATAAAISRRRSWLADR